jgi:type VI secretion system ImpB/VipA family protein
MAKPPKKERVEIKCPVRTDGAIKNKELPWRMLVMLPLSGQSNPVLKRPQLIGTNAPNDLNSLMKKVQPVLRIDVKNKLRSMPSEPAGGAPEEDDIVPLTLSFKNIDDFMREGLEVALSKLMPEFKEKVDALRKYQHLRTQMDMNTELQDIDRDLADRELLDLLSQSRK